MSGVSKGVDAAQAKKPAKNNTPKRTGGKKTKQTPKQMPAKPKKKAQRKSANFEPIGGGWVGPSSNTPSTSNALSRIASNVRNAIQQKRLPLNHQSPSTSQGANSSLETPEQFGQFANEFSDFLSETKQVVNTLSKKQRRKLARDALNQSTSSDASKPKKKRAKIRKNTMLGSLLTQEQSEKSTTISHRKAQLILSSDTSRSAIEFRIAALRSFNPDDLVSKSDSDMSGSEEEPDSFEKYFATKRASILVPPNDQPVNGASVQRQTPRPVNPKPPKTAEQKEKKRLKNLRNRQKKRLKAGV